PGPPGAPLKAPKSTLVTAADATRPAPGGPSRRARSGRPAVTDEQCPADVARTSRNRAQTGASADAPRPEAGDAGPPPRQRSRPVPVWGPVPAQLAGRDPVNTLAGTLVSPRDQAPAPVELEGYAIGPALAPSGSARWSCRRELISSLVNTLRRCHSTVRTDRN